MYLTNEQTLELLSIIEKNQAILFGKQFGPEFLSEYDRSLLTANNVDWESLYNESEDGFLQSFKLGMLSQSLNDTQKLKNLKYDTLKKFVKEGKYFPLGSIERNVVNSIKQAAFSDIKTNNGKIFQDINNILGSHNTIQQQEEFLRKEILSGYKKKNTLREIANDISKKTGDWSRNFDRIVEYNYNSCYQQGRLTSIEMSFGKEQLVYKKVFVTGCKHCVKLCLTNGAGSEPRLFTVQQLRDNGSNIGRKTDEWKCTINSLHPFCRCLTMYKPIGSKWNSEKQQYEIDKSTPILKQPRKPIRVTAQGEEFLV